MGRGGEGKFVCRCGLCLQGCGERDLVEYFFIFCSEWNVACLLRKFGAYITYQV